MASQLTRTFIRNSQLVQNNVRRTVSSQSQSNRGPMDFIRQGVDQLKNIFTNEDPTIEKAAQNYKNITNQSNEAQGRSTDQPTNKSGTHDPAAQGEILRSSGGRATTQYRNYSTSSKGSGGYGGSGTTTSQASPGKRSTSSDPSTGQNAGGSASQQSEGISRSGDSKNQTMSSSAKKGSDGFGGYAGSSSASGNYSSGSQGTEQSGPPKRPTGGYVDRDEKTTDKTKDRKSPPLS